MWTAEGDVHERCATLAERRRGDWQCERCGAQFYDDGRDSDAGWITETHRLLCPACQTGEEARAYTREFLDTVERGNAMSAAKGKAYPPDPAALAEGLEAQLAVDESKRAEWERRLDDGLGSTS